MFVSALIALVLVAPGLGARAFKGAEPETLAFHDFYRLPVGPGGLVPSGRLLASDGQMVTLVGYMAHEETPRVGTFILAPLPVSLGDDDEQLADDLPPTIAYVHATGAAAGMRPRFRGGVLQLSGTLQVGPRREADGRISFVRLMLDEAASFALMMEQHPR